jgi:hypothetical protein
MTEQRLCGQAKLSDGLPCGQRIGEGRDCIWHGPDATPESRSAIARRGGLQTIRSLPADTPLPSFNSREEIVDYAEEQAQLVATGQLDPRLSAEMRGWADLAMKAHELSALDRLTKLEKRIVGRRVS